MSKPETRHYLVVDGGVVVAKRALGPDRQADGSWTFPAAPAGGVLVQPSEYFAARVGVVTGRTEERLARLEAQCLAFAKRLQALERR